MRDVYGTEEDAFAGFDRRCFRPDEADVAPIVLDFCGIEQCTPGFGYGPDGPVIRTVFIMHVIVSGCGRLEKKGRSFPLGAGEAFLIYPGEENYYEADGANPWKYMWIGFHGLHAERMMRRAGFTREEPHIRIDNLDGVTACIRQMIVSSELTYVNELVRMSAMYRLLSIISGKGALEGAEARERRDPNMTYVEAAINMLSSAYGTQIHVEDVARSIGISRNYLDSLFKKEMGLSPKEFLMNFRMEKATALLANTENPVSVIAAEVGYSDPMTFSRIFRKRFHMSPTDFRKAHRAEKTRTQEK